MGMGSGARRRHQEAMQQNQAAMDAAERRHAEALQQQRDAQQRQYESQQQAMEMQRQAYEAQVDNQRQANANLQTAMGEQSARFTAMMEQAEQRNQRMLEVMNRQLEQAREQMKQQGEQWNKANQKAPDVGTLRNRNQQEGKGGQGSTMLTGARGVDKDKLLLGRASLLGG